MDDRIIENNFIKAIQPVAIGRPLAGSVFAVDPNIPRHLQKLKIELNQMSDIKSIEWNVDGKIEKGSNSVLDLPMEKGKHLIHAEVEFKDGRKETTPEVGVTVL